MRPLNYIAYPVYMFNIFLTNGLAHHYQLGESVVILRDIRSDFNFLFHFSMKVLNANSIAPDGMPCSVAPHHGLQCLPMMPGSNELSNVPFSYLQTANSD